MPVRIPLQSLRPDPINARKHTDRNVSTIESSLRELGAARSIVIDEDGRILAGNATVKAAQAAGVREAVIVDADGSALVAVRRTGLSEAEKQRLAITDNRAAELAEWDTDVLANTDPAVLDGLWTDAELEKLLGAFTVGEAEAPALASGDASGFRQMTFTVTEGQAETIERALTIAKAQGGGTDPDNENSNGNALAFICAAVVRHG